MSRITDYVLDQESNGELEYSESNAMYYPTDTNTKGKQEKSLEDTLAFAKMYMKSDKFATEWDNFVRKGFFWCLISY